MRSGVSVALGVDHHVTAATEPKHQEHRGREQADIYDGVERHGQSLRTLMQSAPRHRLSMEVEETANFVGFDLPAQPSGFRRRPTKGVRPRVVAAGGGLDAVPAHAHAHPHLHPGAEDEFVGDRLLVAGEHAIERLLRVDDGFEAVEASRHRRQHRVDMRRGRRSFVGRVDLGHGAAPGFGQRAKRVGKGAPLWSLRIGDVQFRLEEGDPAFDMGKRHHGRTSLARRHVAHHLRHMPHPGAHHHSALGGILRSRDALAGSRRNRRGVGGLVSRRLRVGRRQANRKEKGDERQVNSRFHEDLVR